MVKSKVKVTLWPTINQYVLVPSPLGITGVPSEWIWIQHQDWYTKAKFFYVTIGRAACEACSATWNLGTNSAFALGPRKARSPALNMWALTLLLLLLPALSLYLFFFFFFTLVLYLLYITSVVPSGRHRFLSPVACCLLSRIGADGTVAHMCCYGNVVSNLLYSNEHLQISTVVRRT
jgi:hypothetical protein